MRLTTAYTACVIVTIASVGCSVSSGPKACGDEYRNAGALGEVALADGLSFVDVTLAMTERREPGRPETQHALVGLEVYAHLLSDRTRPSDFLRGHIRVIEVRDLATPSRLIKSYVPPDPPEPVLTDFYRYGMPYDWSITVDEARNLFVGNQLVIEIRTDLASQPLVRVPLTSSDLGDPLMWSRTTISGGSC